MKTGKFYCEFGPNLWTDNISATIMIPNSGKWLRWEYDIITSWLWLYWNWRFNGQGGMEPLLVGL